MTNTEDWFSARKWLSRTKAARRLTTSRGRQVRFEQLEPRQLLTAEGVDSTALRLEETAPAGDALIALPLTAEQLQGEQFGIAMAVPGDLPARFSTSFIYAGQSWTLELDKNAVFGRNTRFLVDDGTGNLVEVDPGADRAYLGVVVGRPDYVVSAVLTEGGLRANIIRPGQPSIIVEPASPAGDDTHRVFVDEAPGTHDHDGDGVADHAPEDHPTETSGGHPPGCTCSACCSLLEASSQLTPSGGQEPVVVASGGGGLAAGLGGSTATLPPSRVIQVREFEVGVEIGSAALLNNYPGSTTQDKVDNAMIEAQKIPGNMDARYLHGAGIKHRLGTVIIRTGSDPFTVSNGNDSNGLSAFRNYWNNNPQEVGTTHDMAVYHVRANPSGLAYVNQVGTSFRYALSASNGPSSWADGTLVHEFGHTWSLGHVPSNPSSSYYESKPRTSGNSAGGSDVFVSVMHGGGSHNIGRLSSGEANQVYNVSLGKTQFGDLVTPGPVKPFGQRDVAASSGSPILIDVIANDYDANNDVLDARLRDTVSHLGGTISLSVGTGPGGRNEILYTPPVTVSGDDFFHYTVIDSTGRTDWGAVQIPLTRITVDVNQNYYNYDLGTPTSPVFSNSAVQSVRITHETTGDISWSGGVLSEDRPNSGQNAYNRDFVRGFASRTWSHKIAPGTWAVTLNMSDPSLDLLNMYVDAEGVRRVSDIDRPIGVNTTFGFEVYVDDGYLDLTFGDDDTLDPRWAVNRIVLTRVGPAPLFVDLEQEEYTYDFGTADSPVFNHPDVQAVRIAPDTFGDVRWNAPVQAVDRGVGNDFNRDLVWATSNVTWSHNIANGFYSVTVNMSDPDRNLDNMFVLAEGAPGLTNLDRPIGTNTTVNFEVQVTDGVLDLTFGDADTNDALWALNRVVLERIGDPSVEVDLDATEYNYDFGSSSSPVENGFQQITPSTYGDIWWSSSVAAIDRSTSSAGPINRDFVTNSTVTTLNHKIANGVWRVTATLGDAAELREDMSISAEGATVVTGLTSNPGQYSEVTFETTATDGSLSLEFNDASLPPFGTTIQESGGRAVFEAENFSRVAASGAQTWEVLGDNSASGDFAIVAGAENIGENHGTDLTGPRVDYDIEFATTGTYRVYVRMLGPDPASDSIQAGLNGVSVTNVSGSTGITASDTWEWKDDVNRGPSNFTVVVDTPGVHTFNMWMREDGVQVDKVVLQKSGADPSGLGPANSFFQKSNPSWVLNSLTIVKLDPPALAGDYNQNGVVDAADYTVWRDQLGSDVPAFQGADGNGDTLIDLEDYMVWKANFGRTAPPQLWAVVREDESQFSGHETEAFAAESLATEEAVSMSYYADPVSIAFAMYYEAVGGGGYSGADKVRQMFAESIPHRHVIDRLSMLNYVESTDEGRANGNFVVINYGTIETAMAPPTAEEVMPLAFSSRRSNGRQHFGLSLPKDAATSDETFPLLSHHAAFRDWGSRL